LTYCAGVYVVGLAPLIPYRLASFPISMASKVMPAFLTAGDAKASTSDFASRNVAVKLF